MEECEYCGHPIRFHIWQTKGQRLECQVELGIEWANNYAYKPEFESKKEKICGCYKVRERIAVS